MQIQTRSLSKTGAKIVITLKGDTNDFTGLLAMGGSRRSIDQRTLMVAGTIALKSGWEASVKIFTRDNNWTAKSSSGFSCHLIKTFDGCTNKQSAQSLARVFSFVKDKMKNTDNLVGADTSVVMLPDPIRAAEEPTDDAEDASYIFVCVSAVIILTIQIY